MIVRRCDRDQRERVIIGDFLAVEIKIIDILRRVIEDRPVVVQVARGVEVPDLRKGQRAKGILRGFIVVEEKIRLDVP